MKLNSLLNLNDDVDYMEQEMKLTYNGVEAYYTIERDNQGNIQDVTGYHDIVQQIDENDNVTIANIEQLTMDDIMNPAKNDDYYEMQQVMYEMYTGEVEEMTCKLYNSDPSVPDEDVTFKFELLECTVTMEE